MTASAFAGSGQHSIYTGRVTNWPTILASAVGLVPLLVLGQMSNGRWAGLAIPLLLAAVGIVLYWLTGSTVRTTAGPNGVTVHLGTIGWPRCTYRLDEIRRAEVVDLPFWSVAGGFWWTPRRTCCTVRSGPTLRLVLHTGRCVTVSAPDPQAAVTAIEEARADH